MLHLASGNGQKISGSRVKDTGVGISKENLRKLFNPFFTTKAKGVGLGLSNVKRVVEDHGGTITVESREEGKGTTVTVRLPPYSLSIRLQMEVLRCISQSRLSEPKFTKILRAWSKGS